MKNKKTNLFLFLSAPLFLSFFSIVSASSTEKEPKSTERWSTLKQTVITLGELRFKAKKVQLSLKTKLVNALHEKGHEFEALTPTNVKGYERLIQKVATDYHFDFSKITDIARMSLVFDSMCSLEKAYKTLLEDAHFKSKYKIIKNKNRFNKHAHYKDINLVLLDLEHNFPVEIQLHHVCMINTKNSCGHTIYERYRDLEAKKEAGKKLTQEEELEMGELNITTKHLYQNGCRNYGLKCAHKSATPDIDRHQYQLSDWALGKMTHPDNPTKTTNKKIYQRRLKRLLFSAQEADMEKIRIFADLGPTEEIDRAHLFKVFFKEKVKK